MNTKEYFFNFEKKVGEVYAIAERARAKGLDPVDKVEIPTAKSLAEKVTGLISAIYPQLNQKKIVDRILELEGIYGKLDVAVTFKIAEEIAKQKFCKFASLLEAIDAGIRVGFAYITLGVVSSPIEGFTKLEVKKTRNNKDYLVAYFSGPIRSAGTTASCVALMLIDYLREMFGFSRYDPTEEEIKRYVIENTDYHERVTNLQYMPTEEEMIFLAKNLPIQIDGEPTEKLEVSNYKNLKRVGTNYIRGGMCLIFSEGLAQKAAKAFRLLESLKKKGFKTTGWDFLKEYIKLHEKRNYGETDDSPIYIKDLVAGRPIFGHPAKSGGFRFRYGRGRVSGFSAASIHPATMAVTDGFIAIGTQLKIEKPTKGMVATVCDIIDGPIVKLSDGSVKKINFLEEAKKLYPEIVEIIYLGDLLFPFSDVVNRNAQLIKPGYVEEWWKLELKEKAPEIEKNIDCFNVDFEKAVYLSEKFKIPLHPKFIFYWTEISKKQFLSLIHWLKHSKINKKIIFPYNKYDQERFKLGKRALELLGIEHKVTIENVVLGKEDSKALFANLGLNYDLIEKERNFLDLVDVEQLVEKVEKLFSEFSELKGKEKILRVVNSLSRFEIKDKAGEFIGARMGRPEKAKLRKLTGSPNVLFPIGREGGRFRSVQEACNVGKIKSTFPIYYCENCKRETIYPLCENCNNKTKKMYYCSECGKKSFDVCEKHQNSKPFIDKEIDINYYFEKAVRNLNLNKNEIPSLIKGVRGTSSLDHCLENLSKGILRALYDLQVNKDGTIRFDATELPLIAFKPKEIFVSVEKLRKLGYDKDIYGNELINDEQILELKPHDILLPICSESTDEKADDVFIRVCNFIDDLLVRFYKLKPFYNVKKREDLVGHLGVCMAPHNCAGVICRIIGFSNTQGLLASPYMHAAIRRDCDGDEAAVMLLLDVLLNFSRSFLPSHRGGTQDAPLVLNAKIDAGEVDDQILDFEIVEDEYPLELYKLAEQKKHSSEVKGILSVKNLLRERKDPFVHLGFTHNTSNFNDGILCSSYKLLATMQDKVSHQMDLVEKIRAVDTSDTARLILERHFIRDIRGNLRNFSSQAFRCVGCNKIVRRPPLTGVCPSCGGKLIFTVNEGGIKKYLDLALELTKKYELSVYLKQNLELIQRSIESVFGRETEKQEALQKWF